jgi:hypothetical protein
MLSTVHKKDVNVAEGTVMQIKPARSVPAVLKRAFDAFRANDPIGMAEAYAVDARLATQYDKLIARAFRLEGLEAPVVASSAIGILRFYAYELSMIEVKDVDLVSVTENNGGLDVVSRWSINLQETGKDHVGFCNTRWFLDRSGRQLTGGQNFCGLLPTRSTLSAN